MDELTPYFVTTDRVDAEDALASLRGQGIPRPVVIIRNVRPLHAAYTRTLECQTPYCLVLDDDTILNPGMAQKLVDRFRAMRAEQPAGFKLNARVFCEAKMRWDSGGLKLFYAPHLKRVGWPNAPHVSETQTRIAREMGLRTLGCAIEAGTQRRGSDFDVYKKYLWMQIRIEAGQLTPIQLAPLVRRARGGETWLWFAILGLVDGMAVGSISSSKDEAFLGPIGKTLDFSAIGAEDVSRILAASRFERVMGQPMPGRGVRGAPSDRGLRRLGPR
ncbi:MAG: hypothetical protein WD036_07460 [Bauldia sp.]